MTCGLFLILHLVLCVLAIDPGTSTVSTETRNLIRFDRYRKNNIKMIKQKYIRMVI